MGESFMTRLGRYFWSVVLLIVLGITYGIYNKGLSGPFIFDDGINIVGNEALRLNAIDASSLKAAAFSIPNGLFGRPLSMVSFALNCYFDNCANAPFLNPFAFKLTNLVIHLLNGVLVAIVVRQVIRQLSARDIHATQTQYIDYFPVLVASAWLLHPFALTGVLYTVQRMTSLSAFFCLAGVALYQYGRRRILLGRRHGEWAMLSTALLFTPLSVFAKEVGLLMPVYILLVEYYFFKFQGWNQKSTFVVLFTVCYSLLPIAFGIAYLGTHMPSLLSGYDRREFDLWERLLTEARVFWFYISQIIAPNITAMGVFHDDFPISRGILDPVETLYSVMGIGVTLCLVWVWRAKHALISFGLLFYMVGQSMESTFIPLELIHEHRNYLPMLGILLAALHLLLGLDWGKGLMLLRRFSAFLVVALFSVVTYARVQEWSSAEALWQAEALHHPNSVRVAVAQADYYANALSFDPVTKLLRANEAEQSYTNALKIDPLDVNAHLGLIKLWATNGHPIGQDALNTAKKALAAQYLPANVNDKLIALARCTIETTCSLKREDVRPLIQAALENKKLTSNGKALIYSAAIYFQAEVEKNYDLALQSARAAIALDPDLSFQLWVAAIYLDMKKPQEARDQLALVERLDIRKIKSKDVAQLHVELNRQIDAHN